MKFFCYFLILSFFITNSPVFSEENCVYEYDPKQTKLEWTAFKFTERTGVKGTFDQISVSGKTKASSVHEIVTKLQFKISTSSINSSVADRDEKIKKNFFGSHKSGKFITGKVSELVGIEKGSAKLNLQMGASKTNIPVQFEWKGDTVEMVGTVDVVTLGLTEGLSKLNAVCSELHKGTDGVSKLWPTVDVKVVSTFKKTCK
ncbi:YceI family protein [Leptospira sp. 96542]|nr:YceI family protein [Leptospira sp. 96542]